MKQAPVNVITRFALRRNLVEMPITPYIYGETKVRLNTLTAASWLIELALFLEIGR